MRKMIVEHLERVCGDAFVASLPRMFDGCADNLVAIALEGVFNMLKWKCAITYALYNVFETCGTTVFCKDMVGDIMSEWWVELLELLHLAYREFLINLKCIFIYGE
jgi:hypothetical protein